MGVAGVLDRRHSGIDRRRFGLILGATRRQALRRSRDYGPCIGAGSCNARRSAVDRSVDRDSALVEFQAIGNDRHGGDSGCPKSVNLARMVRHGLLQLCSPGADRGRLQDSLVMDHCPTVHASPTTPTSVDVSHQEWPFGLERQASERINWARRLLHAWPLRLPRGCRALFFCISAISAAIASVSKQLSKRIIPDPRAVALSATRAISTGDKSLPNARRDDLLCRLLASGVGGAIAPFAVSSQVERIHMSGTNPQPRTII